MVLVFKVKSKVRVLPLSRVHLLPPAASRVPKAPRQSSAWAHPDSSHVLMVNLSKPPCL